MPSVPNVTELLVGWSQGDQGASNQLLPLVYGELRRLARRYLRHERPNHTLQTTALVHEAYLRLVDQKNTNWQNRSQFFALSSQLMRRILVDYARSHGAARRGGGITNLSLDEAMIPSPQNSADLMALDEALTCLTAMDPHQGRVVELRVFGGLTVDETAEALGISPRTVKREWSMAKAWLHQRIRME